MKTASRNKLLHCFRPMDVVIREPTSVVDRSGADYIDHDMKVSESGCSMNSEKSSKTVRRPGKRTFSRVVKAVFSETILAKRIRDRKGFSKKRGSLDLGFSNDKPMISSPNEVISSCTSSSSSSLTPKSVVSSMSLSESVKQKEGHKSNEEEHKEKPHLSMNTGLFMLLISLAMTILCGRLSAIIFTSIWLCLLPLSWHAGVPGQRNVIKSPEMESEDHKKNALNIGRAV